MLLDLRKVGSSGKGRVELVIMLILDSEIPSARLRAMNVAQAAATQWLFNFVVARSEFPSVFNPELSSLTTL